MSKKLYVGNLPYDFNEEALKQLFSEAGTVESVKTITDQNTGRSKGFAFVEMSTEEEADKAIEALKGREIEGRQIRVDKANPPRKGGGGGGGRGRPRY